MLMEHLATSLSRTTDILDPEDPGTMTRGFEETIGIALIPEPDIPGKDSLISPISLSKAGGVHFPVFARE